MRKLNYHLDMEHLQKIKQDIVPVLFTEHQFGLIEKKLQTHQLTASEKNEFSRTISRKMKAVYAIMDQQEKDVYAYGKQKMIPSRLILAKKYLQMFARKFKNKHVLISGSFLHSRIFNDIDIFIFSKYDKDDYKEGKFHINYLQEDAHHSLFFASLQKLCLSNRQIEEPLITEKADLDTFLSLYQELGNDLERHFSGVEKTLREFLLQAAYLMMKPLPDSAELRLEVKGILNTRKPLELIKKIVVETLLLGRKKKDTLHSVKELLASYREIIKEYPQHTAYYKEMTEPLNEVMALAG